MPLTPGKSPKTISKNISEFHKGPTFSATAEKFGQKRADKQAVAVALNEARRTGKGQSQSHTSVGCGHASCGSKCSVGSGQAATFLRKSVGKGQAADAKEERGEVQHERKEMGLIKKLEKMHPPSMLRTGKGQAPGQPVIPGIQQQRGSPMPVNFGDPAMPPYTSGTPRSTRQGPYNTQGQGPPSGRGGRKPRMPKSGPVVHPGKRGKMTT